MKYFTDQRACERCRYTAVILFSYFNKDYCYEAQTLNHCAGGMRFKSEVILKPGATVYIRVINFHPNGAWSDDCRGLRSVSLAEVKWCKKALNETGTFYEIGAKYYLPEY